ncbi:heterokaryon incompatibility protein-domain-containing protein, partial [Leptodontidium sp. 2 PMI_412]
MPNLPTRVIDVGNGFDDPIRLIASQGTHGLYCTLSYRWYDSNTFKTTRENIEELQQGIPENKLHQTIKDAITTTRTLGLRYLWVDAICIIQNDKDDWEKEAATMSDVYENSMLTIAAIDEPRADQGMFRKRTYSPRPYNRDYPRDSATGYFGYSHPFYVYANNCRRRPLGELDTRGWCLQEQFLSPRILSYADGELFWDCAELTASESYPGGTEAVKFWWNIVEEFTGRHLTVEMDRFVAIEGISNVVTEYTNEQMVLGMWKSDLPRHLLWWVNTITGKPKLTDVLKRPKEFLCPSWSWAS